MLPNNQLSQPVNNLHLCLKLESNISFPQTLLISDTTTFQLYTVNLLNWTVVHFSTTLAISAATDEENSSETCLWMCGTALWVTPSTLLQVVSPCTLLHAQRSNHRGQGCDRKISRIEAGSKNTMRAKVHLNHKILWKKHNKTCYRGPLTAHLSKSLSTVKVDNFLIQDLSTSDTWSRTSSCMQKKAWD